MTHPSWAPHGAALRAFLAGREDAEIVVRGEDGEEERTPARVFFRGPEEFSSLEEAALDLCRGRVLDVGAGAGCHSLVLQERGLAVVAIDVAPEAVEVMRSRGVRDVRCGDVFAWAGERFDTLLILMNGIGLVGSLDGLDRFLRDTRRLLNAGGQILVDSYDPGEPDPARPDRYVGEMRFQLEYAGRRGAFYDFLFLDCGTLGRHAERAGWRCESIWQEDEGHYLARLTAGTAGG
ncbi:MAG: methyltransferase domain-containing protein [candidate division NC10 bacterium]|nr:methyltransferase domain-containing protein [candidate division NC10 bacterium]